MSVTPAPDTGAQPERTALAWQRTSLAVVLACTAVLRLAAVRGSVGGSVVAVLAALLAGVALVRVRFGYVRSASDLVSGGGTVMMGPAAFTAASIALLGAAAMVVELM